MRLDLSSLRNAIGQVESALAYHGSEIAQSDPDLALHLRAAAIQAFEFTYELCIKMLRRYLAATEPNPSAVTDMTFHDLIRLGWERGLLQADIVAWRDFRSDRGATSHAYDQRKAQEVFEAIPAFLAEAKHLLERLAERQVNVE